MTAGCMSKTHPLKRFNTSRVQTYAKLCKGIYLCCLLDGWSHLPIPIKIQHSSCLLLRLVFGSNFPSRKWHEKYPKDRTPSSFDLRCPSVIVVLLPLLLQSLLFSQVLRGDTLVPGLHFLIRSIGTLEVTPQYPGVNNHKPCGFEHCKE